MHSRSGFLNDSVPDSAGEERGEEVEDFSTNVTSDANVNVTSVDHHIVGSQRESLVGIHGIREIS